MCIGASAAAPAPGHMERVLPAVRVLRPFCRPTARADRARSLPNQPLIRDVSCLREKTVTVSWLPPESVVTFRGFAVFVRPVSAKKHGKKFLGTELP
jgi:hypothetical protein